LQNDRISGKLKKLSYKKKQWRPPSKKKKGRKEEKT
jgi:hypothetical protein